MVTTSKTGKWYITTRRACRPYETSYLPWNSSQHGIVENTGVSRIHRIGLDRTSQCVLARSQAAFSYGAQVKVRATVIKMSPFGHVAGMAQQASSEPSMTTVKRLQLVVSVLSRNVVRRSDGHEMPIADKLRKLLIAFDKIHSTTFYGKLEIFKSWPVSNLQSPKMKAI